MRNGNSWNSDWQRKLTHSKLIRTRGDQVSCCTVAEFVKDAVAVGLLHFGVNVVARVSEFRNFLSQQFDTVDRVAKDNALVDLELGKKCVEAVDLLSLFDIGIELGDTAECEFVHEVDAVRIGDEILAKVLDGDGKGRAKEADLVVWVTKTDNLFQDGLELGRKKLVCFVHNDGFDRAQIRNFFGRKIKDTSRGGNYNVHSVVETHDIVFERCSTSGNHALHSHVLAHFSHNGGCLKGQFSGWNEDQDCKE